jgi:hypothetical protein
MNPKIATRRVSLLLLLFTLCAVAAQAQGTSFTYQGRLTDGGTAASGNYDLQFALWDSNGGGTQVGATQTIPAVAVSAGIFTVQLDFGATAFPGAPRFLEISARSSGVASYTTLAPRQQIASTPYAIRSLNASTADAVTVTGLPGGSGNYIQNATTPQANASFNVGGNGIIGGNVGIGTPNPQANLDVNGTVQIASGGSGGQVIFAAPNGESGMLIRGTGRADIRFDGSTLKLLAGVSTGAPISTNGIAISTSGNVGIGTTNPTTRLYVLNNVAGTSAIYGESASGPGVQGKSVGSRGVFGESASGRGVFGQSDTGEGVLGTSTSGAGVSGGSTSGSGVYGESPVSSLTAAGVYGKGTGSGSIGVIGESNIANAVGVFGVSTSPAGVGVYARNNSGGRAIVAEGNVAQSLSSNGLVKAMIYVDQAGNILRCYNGITNVSTGMCGFVINHSINSPGVYGIDFNFQVNDRFISITTRQPPGLFNTHVGASFLLDTTTALVVYTFITNVETNGNDAYFMIIVY